MKKYIKPSIELELFKGEDILTASTISVDDWMAGGGYDNSNVVHVDYNSLSSVSDELLFSE